MATCPKCNSELEHENASCPDCVSTQKTQKKKLKLTKQVDDPSLAGYTASEGKVTTFNLSPKIIGIIIAAVVGIGFLGGLLSGPSEIEPPNQSVTASKDSSQTSKLPIAETAPRKKTVEDEITLLFSKMRRANLQEDINGFMQYYSASFPGRSEKRERTLETWGKYDFASLDFFVFDLIINDNRAEVSVGWEIALLENGQSKPRLIETTNEVVLEKEESGWLIVSLQ